MGVASLLCSHETPVYVCFFRVVHLPPDCRRGSWNIPTNDSQSGISLFPVAIGSTANVGSLRNSQAQKRTSIRLLSTSLPLCAMPYGHGTLTGPERGSGIISFQRLAPYLVLQYGPMWESIRASAVSSLFRSTVLHSSEILCRLHNRLL